VTAPTVFTATVKDSSEPVTWSLSGAGSLSGTSGPRVTYRPPALPGTAQAATLQASVPGATASVSLRPGLAVLAPAQIAALGAPVTVLYDEREIPHVTCAAANDCYAVQGWLHASDRLFQMDFLRRVATGKLAELIGTLGLSQDVQLRTLFTTRAGQRLGDALAAALDPEARAALTSYVAGINAYLAALRASGKPLPGEYAQLPYLVTAADVPDWTLSDVLSFVRLQQYSLSETLSQETAFGTFAAAYGGDAGKMDVWIRSAQPDTELSHTLTTTLPTGTLALAPAPKAPAARSALARAAPAPRPPGAWGTALASAQRQAADLRALLQPFQGAAGSNNWVVDKDHSASGQAMVANDPHLSLQYPPNFYLATLTSTKAADHLDVTGGAFPGTPGAQVGRGKSVGWGVTVVGYDVTDLYLETLLPCPAGVSAPFCAVLFKGGPVAVLPVPQAYTIRTDAGLHTLSSAELTALGVPAAVVVVPHHGPLVKVDTGAMTGVSVRWTGHEDWTDDLHGFLGLDTATDVDAAMAALDSYATGAQNFVLADEAGNIAYYPHALVPLRPWAGTLHAGRPLLPWFPLPGDGSAEWGTGNAADHCASTAYDGTTLIPAQAPAAACWIPGAQLPQRKNPAWGFLATANADPLGVSDGNPPLPVDAFGHYLSFAWDDSTAFRHARITERLSALTAAGKVSQADMESIQSDHVSRAGAAFQRLLAAYPAQPTQPDFEAARALLATWKADGFGCPTGLVGTDPAASPLDPDPTRARDSAACYLFHFFLRTLLQNVFSDELAVAGLDVDGGQAIKGMLHMLEHPTTADQTFCNDVDTAGNPVATHTCPAQVVTALVTAYDTLSASHGTDPARWAWGRVHTMQPVSQFALVTTGYQPGPYARPGGAFTVDVGNPSLSGSGPSFDFGSSGNVRHVSVMDPLAPRVRMQLPGPERALPTGTIVGPDLLGEWVSNTYFDYAHGASQAQSAAVATQTFHP
jgi:penicillin amidase